MAHNNDELPPENPLSVSEFWSHHFERRDELWKEQLAHYEAVQLRRASLKVKLDNLRKERLANYEAVLAQYNAAQLHRDPWEAKLGELMELKRLCVQIVYLGRRYR